MQTLPEWVDYGVVNDKGVNEDGVSTVCLNF